MNRPLNRVSVLDCATNTVTAIIGVGSLPTGLAVTPNGRFAYVANSGGTTVSVISTASNSVVDTITTGVGPSAVAITPNGAFAYVTNSGSNPLGDTVSVIATATNTVVGTVTVGALPAHLAITPDGAFVYVVSQDSSQTVSVIATATNTVVATIPLSGLNQVAITPNGAFAYVTSSQGIYVIATATNQVTTTIPNPAKFVPGGIAFTQDGVFAYVTNTIGSVEVINTSTNTVVDTITPTNDTGGPTAVGITPDGASAYVANGGASPTGNSISVIATSSNTVTATIPVGAGPAWVAFVPTPIGAGVTPNPASGLSNTFALKYVDTNGASSLNAVGAIFSWGLTTLDSCTVLYAPATNLLYLLDDAGTGSSNLTPGAGTLSNSQCTINGSATTVTTSGSTLTLNLGVSAASTYTGKQNVFLFASDTSSLKTDWLKAGTWTPAANQPPSVVSATPNPAAGLSNTFALAYSDANGATDLNTLSVIFNSATGTSSSCYVLYSTGTNLLYLLNDAGTGSTTLTPGSGTVSNSQCTITGSGTSVTRSGDTLTLNLDVTASPSYTGVKNIFMSANDNSGANTGTVNAGTWTP